MDSISSLNSAAVLESSLVFGVTYPIIPTLVEFTSRIVDLLILFVLSNSVSCDKSKFAPSTGKSTALRKGARPSEPFSNSWLPRD